MAPGHLFSILCVWSTIYLSSKSNLDLLDNLTSNISYQNFSGCHTDQISIIQGLWLLKINLTQFEGSYQTWRR